MYLTKHWFIRYIYCSFDKELLKYDIYLFFVQLNSNTMETKSLTILINESVMLMRGVGYSEKSILRFKQIWDSKLNNFMSVKGFEHYSTSIGEAFLATLPEEKVLMSSHLRRSITILDSVLQSGSISRYIPQKTRIWFQWWIRFCFLAINRLQESYASFPKYPLCLHQSAWSPFDILTP